MTTTTHVQMCAAPDAVCLQGGCGYCSSHGTFQAVSYLRKYAEGNGLLKDYLYGYNTNWPNRNKRILETHG